MRSALPEVSVVAPVTKPSRSEARDVASAMAQRRPSTDTSVAIPVPAGHQVEKKASSPSVRLRRTRRPRVHIPLRVAP
jgi:hypothetical protein